ncbi:MAG: NAD-dependent epimerase/dehydratase family protein [Planctomyces sp.]|nr:NAD-dependent epimerase/dehydratase family protein [Planctomyces sp.]
MIQRIAITGSSGFYGRALIRKIRQEDPSVQILGCDLIPPRTGTHPLEAAHQFAECDITSEHASTSIADFQPDTIVHLAFVVNPMRNERRMRQINVDGTKQVLKAARIVKPKRLLIGSSATAYGAWEDNAVPMTESFRLKSRDEYRYAADKVEVERMLAEFRDQQPGITVSWTRPCMIYGPGISNYLTQFILEGPLIVLPGGNNTEFQFVHVDDVADATWTILRNNGAGPFNVAPPDWFTLRELANMSGRRTAKVPLNACLTFTTIWWALRLPKFRFPSGLWYFIRFPWVIHPERLQSEMNFEFRYSSRDVIRQLLSDAGRLRD